MIVKAFLRWAETAKVADRARAANALGRAWLQSAMASGEREAARMAMTCLLDDPSPRVRLALAEALAAAPGAPRAVVMSLAGDQPEIAATVLAASPVLSDADLIDLAGRGDDYGRAVIASRKGLSAPVAAAIAEIADPSGVAVLLENETARIGRLSLRRIAERFGADAEIRDLLLGRDDLPADVRHLLVSEIGAALAGHDLVRNVIGSRRMELLCREVSEAAAVAIAETASRDEIPPLVEHLRRSGRLTPAFLMHALCLGRVEFFAEAIRNLSGLEERRVRALLATGRMHAVRALFETVGLARDVSAIFVEAVMLWRKAAEGDDLTAAGNICGALLEKFRAPGMNLTAVAELLDLVEKLDIARQRQIARLYADDMVLDAA